MGITEFLSEYITAFISQTGYLSVFVLMVLESMVFPIPSEAVMPFAGFLIVSGQFSWIGVFVASIAGSIVGSMLSYYIGAYGGKPFLRKFGRFLLLQQDELDATVRYFQKHGEITILICRFVPVIRHLISLPAGFSRMNIGRFLFYTIIGAGCWNMFLTAVGFYCRQNWQIVMHYSHFVDMGVLGILVLLIGLYIYRHLRQARKHQ